MAADPPAPAQRRPARVVGVTAICVLAGVLFGTSASLARQDPGAQPSDLAELITARDHDVRGLADSAESLKAEVKELRTARSSSRTAQVTRQAEGLAAGVGTGAVSGPGLQVTLTDAGYSLDTLPDGYTVDDVVVHQQDLQGVINALWGGGAEALMVQDQRIVSTSAVKCVGNTLYVQGRVYSPPYTVTAIGDVDALRASLEADPVVGNYRDWAVAVGLGYAVEDAGEVQMPAFSGTVRPRHAQVVEQG